MGSAVIGSSASHDASNQAANSQAAALTQNQNQFAQTQANEAPFLSAGTNAVKQQADLAGANGSAAQQAAIAQVQSGPLYGSLTRVGDEGVLQNASATGGLRGGNVNTSLFNSHADALTAAIQQQLSALNGVSAFGQAAAGGLASAGQNAANANGQYLTNAGNAQAAGTVGSAGAITGGLNQLSGIFGKYANPTSSIFGGGGGGTSAFTPAANGGTSFSDYSGADFGF